MAPLPIPEAKAENIAGDSGSVYQLMGPLRVTVGRRDLTPSPYKLRVILAVLLFQANRTVSVETLTEAVWGDDPPRTARQALRVYVSQLRRVLENCPNATLNTRAPGYQLEVSHGSIDLHLFTELRLKGLESEREGDLERARQLYNQALDLHRGDILEDVSHSLILQSAAVHVEEMWITTFQRRIDIDLRSMDSPDILTELRWLCGSRPLHEGLHARLMLGLAKTGRTKEALDVHTAFRSSFIEQLGIEPHRVLGHVQQAILSSDHGALDELRVLEAV